MVTDVFDPQLPSPRAIASICRCASPAEHARRADQGAADSARERTAELSARTPDPVRFHIEDSEEVGDHLVLRVRYPNCAACAYEGSKVLVLLDRSLKDAIKWRRIDPHFRDPSIQTGTHEAPSPAARFPGSKDGWTDAIAYAAIAYARGKAQ